MARMIGFWKMHGLGNDYIVIDNRGKILDEQELPSLAIKLCERRFGIGADGLLLVHPSQRVDVKMRIFNPDGSEAEMCGNGIRCLAKYCFESGLTRKTSLLVETMAGIKTLSLKIEGDTVKSVRVIMGSPSFEAEEVPIKWNGPFIDKPIRVGETTVKATALSMGNPHCVVFIENVENYPVKTIGPLLENHELFPRRANVEFVQVISKDRLKVRVWERGVGETMACGTGACASVVAAKILGKVNEAVTVRLPGGELIVEYRNGVVVMEGPVEKVFEGIINL
ncbi:MAG: diaminopimelate epimerase [Nitrososphaerota archaeon]|nr:diaminopimelate epimerase [Candidatus Bathyarchaeota archaeon]MDW8023472.1 diaminopimelate epimerase [Nitrososphaerota archaeon]